MSAIGNSTQVLSTQLLTQYINSGQNGQNLSAEEKELQALGPGQGDGNQHHQRSCLDI